MERLKAICEQILRKPLSPDDNFVDAGLNANRALNIIRLFYLQTGIELDVNAFLEYPNLARLRQMLGCGKTGPDGKLILLREGKDESPPLFVYAGGVSVFLELDDLTRAIEQPGPIYGVSISWTDRPFDNPATVADEVQHALDTIRHHQPEGPVHLLGYSFGGVLALEIARALTAEGRTVAFCGLIDTPQNDHVWPLHRWTGFILARLAAKLQRVAKGVLAGMPARREAQAILTPDQLQRLSAPKRGHQVAFRFLNPRQPDYPYRAPQWLGGNTPGYTARACELLRMKGLYRPRRYDGPVTFFFSMQGSPVDCDARALWRPYLPQAEWVAIRGNHLSMIIGRNARTLAAEISSRLASAHDM